MIERHLAKMRCRAPLSPEEEAAIRDSVEEERVVRRGTVVIAAGELLHQSTMLLDGMMARFRNLRSGERQITALHVAGDFVDLHGFVLKRLDHGILTLTDCTIATVSHERLRHITETLPRLGRTQWFSTAADAAMHREWEVSLGRRPAIGRLAHLFCELLVRLRIVGLVDDDSFEMPLIQATLGECLGLTGVHVNRTLQELRARGLVELVDRRLTVRDFPALAQLAEFDDTYLYLERRER